MTIWNSTFKGPRKPMNRMGKVSRQRLAVNRERKAAMPELLNVCEIAPILRHRGITFTSCGGEMTWAHARKRHRRSKKALPGTPEHEETVARACEIHHETYLDMLKPDVTCEIVMEAIRRRKGSTAAD